MSFILTMTSDEDALSNALMLSKSNHFLSEKRIYMLWTQNLCMDKRLERVVSLLESIDSDVAVEYATELLVWISWGLEDSVNHGLVENDRFERFASAGKEIGQLLENTQSLFIVHANLYSKIYDLYSKFGIQCTVNELASKNGPETIATNFVQNKLTAGSISIFDNDFRLLADSLELDYSEICIFIADFALKSDDIALMLMLCRFLINESDVLTYRTMARLIRKIMNHIKNVSLSSNRLNGLIDMPKECKEIVQHFMTVCDPSDLPGINEKKTVFKNLFRRLGSVQKP